MSGYLTPDALKPKDYLEVPADRPGLYLIRAFSGARFDPQKVLISMLPQGQREANHMTVLNILLASQDGLSFLSKEVGGFDCRQKFLMSLLTSTLQTVEREAAQGVLSSDVIKGLVLNAAKSFVKDYFIKYVLLDSKLKGMSQSGKAISASIGILGKIATAGKILERMNALANLAGASGNPQRVWTVQAIEDTLIVVGNPWQPRISGFFPQEGYRGALVRIDGRNFDKQTNLNFVTFGQLSTDPENPPVQARAEVVVASESSLVVRVPEEAETGFITVGAE